MYTEGMKNKKRKITIICVLAVFVIFLILFLNINSNRPSDTFIRIIDRVYTTEDVQVYDSNQRDVTEEFREKFRSYYERGDYDGIYGEIPGLYTFGSSKAGALD